MAGSGDHQAAANTWVDPRTAKTTVEEWCKRWLAGYGTRKPSTVRMAEVHVAKIVAAFGPRRLDSLRPSDIKSWLVQLQDEYAASYVYALHARLAQILADAVHGTGSQSLLSSYGAAYRLSAAVRGHNRADLGSPRCDWASAIGRACCWRPSLA